MAAPTTGLPDELVPKQALRSLQNIAGALLAGHLSFAAVVVVMVQWQNQGQALAAQFDSAYITWMACAALVIWLPLSGVVSRIMTRRYLRRIIDGVEDEQPRRAYQASLHGAIFSLINHYIERKLAARGVFKPQNVSVVERILTARQSTMIVGFAVLQGIGFLANLAYLFEGRRMALGVTGIVAVLIIWKFPTAERTRAWIVQQAEEIERLQQTANRAT